MLAETPGRDRHSGRSIPRPSVQASEQLIQKCHSDLIVPLLPSLNTSTSGGLPLSWTAAFKSRAYLKRATAAHADERCRPVGVPERATVDGLCAICPRKPPAMSRLSDNRRRRHARPRHTEGGAGAGTVVSLRADLIGTLRPRDNAVYAVTAVEITGPGVTPGDTGCYIFDVQC